ncbi:MAG: protease modulator HflC [Lachnospiraceae bacterium]|nr:protease modulator HflC [Lachnospiraceae bacterium]
MKRLMGNMLGVILLVAALVSAAGSLVVTYPNEYKLIRQFGEIVRVVDTPGVSFKIPFVQSSASVPRALQLYDIPKSDVITRDKKSMIADAFVLWRVSDPVLFTRHLNGQVAQAQSRISASVFSSMKSVISNMDQAEIIENRNGKLALDISGNIGSSLDGYGIQVLAVETKSLDMPDDNKQAVYDRMISERNNIAASYTAQGKSSAQKIKNDTTKEVSVMKSEARAQAEKIMAEGEAQYMQILSDAYNDASKADFYNFVRSLDAARSALEGGNNTLILDKSSPMAQIFYGY